MSVDGADEPVDLAQRVDGMVWYHTFDLPGGVTTRGLFDHRRFVHRLPIPQDMSGMRCLDACAADGFFGFEMARRGASVVSLDLPDPNDQDMHASTEGTDVAGAGYANVRFNIVKQATGLDVERVDGSIYDVADMGLGNFDFVFLGNILLHLQDPIRALKELRHVMKGGKLLSVEAISGSMTVMRPFTATAQFSWRRDNTFWVPSLLGHRAILSASGYQIERAGRPLLQPMGSFHRRYPGRHNFPRTPREALWWTFTRQFGKTTSWILAIT